MSDKLPSVHDNGDTDVTLDAMKKTDQSKEGKESADTQSAKVKAEAKKQNSEYLMRRYGELTSVVRSLDDKRFKELIELVSRVTSSNPENISSSEVLSEVARIFDIKKEDRNLQHMLVGALGKAFKLLPKGLDFKREVLQEEVVRQLEGARNDEIARFDREWDEGKSWYHITDEGRKYLVEIESKV